MRLRPTLLHRYIFGEIFSPFISALFVFTGILFLIRILKLVDLAVNKHVPIGDILLLFSLVIPGFLEIAVPMALLIGILSAFGRLSSDSELVVIRASGVSLKQLAGPVRYFALFAAIVTLVIGLWLRPMANYKLGSMIFEVVKQRTSAGLVSGVFNDLNQLTLYAEKIDDEGSNLDNIIISDRRTEPAQSILATHGLLVSDELERTLSLRLYNGSIHQGSGLDYNITYFDVNSINLNEKELVEGGPSRSGKKASEMYLPELNSSIAKLQTKPQPLSTKDRKSRAQYRVERHKRFVLPVACLCVAFIAMALGIQPSRGHSSWGPVANVTMGILVIVLYYTLFAFVEAVSKKVYGEVWFIMWFPNMLFAFLAYYLFRIMQSERWFAVSHLLGALFEKINSLLNFSTKSSEAH